LKKILGFKINILIDTRTSLKTLIIIAGPKVERDKAVNKIKEIISKGKILQEVDNNVKQRPSYCSICFSTNHNIQSCYFCRYCFEAHDVSKCERLPQELVIDESEKTGTTSTTRKQWRRYRRKGVEDKAYFRYMLINPIQPPLNRGHNKNRVTIYS